MKTHTARSRVAVLVAVPVVALLMLTGCDDESAGDAAGAAAQNAPAAEPSAEAEDTGAVVTVDVAEQEQCLVGSWLMDPDEYAVIKGVTTGAAGAAEDVSGVLMVTFLPDGIATVMHDDWRFTIKDGPNSVAIEDTSSEEADYVVTAEGTTLADFRPVDDPYITERYQSTVTKNGEVTVSSDKLAPTIFDRVTIVCNDESLTLTNPFGTFQMGRAH